MKSYLEEPTMTPRFDIDRRECECANDKCHADMKPSETGIFVMYEHLAALQSAHEEQRQRCASVE